MFNTTSLFCCQGCKYACTVKLRRQVSFVLNFWILYIYHAPKFYCMNEYQGGVAAEMLFVFIVWIISYVLLKATIAGKEKMLCYCYLIMMQREKLKYKKRANMTSIFAFIYNAFWSQVFLNFPCSTAHEVQENQRSHLHGGVSKGIPKAFPGPPHHTIVILALVLPSAMELSI